MSQKKTFKRPADLDELSKLTLAKALPCIPFLRGHTPAICARAHHAAEHEAAHFVACVACPSSSVAGVVLKATKRGAGSGRFDGAELMKDEEWFVTLAGYAYEELRADLTGQPAQGGEDDYKRVFGFGHTCQVEGEREKAMVLGEARLFVREHHLLIQETALGLLLMANAEGTCTENSAHALLVSWVGARVRPFKSRTPSRHSARGLYRYSLAEQEEYHCHMQEIANTQFRAAGVG